MTIGRRRSKEAIAYRRVSTDKQGESGLGLEGQLAAISTYASLDKYHVVESFQDVGSGRGRRNLIDRPGLQQAIAIAKATGRPILVSSLDRLSRETKTVDEIVRKHGITIISAGDGKLLNPVIVASKAARAQREGEVISRQTKEGLARKKAEGVVLGNRTNLPEARRRAVERKKQIASETVREIVAVLDELGDIKVAVPQLVEILNERGILTSRKLQWTVPALRRPFRAARDMIKQRDARAKAMRYGNNPNFGRF